MPGDVQHVATQTPRLVREQVHAGRSVLVHGAQGTGRTTAVLQSLSSEAPVWIHYGERSSRAARAVVALARALETPIPGEMRRGDLAGALGVLLARAGDRLIIVDDADRLLDPIGKADDLWAAYDATWIEVLHSRPVVLIAERCVTGDWPRLAQVTHEVERKAPYLWTGVDHAWNELAQRLLPRFSRFAVARAAAAVTSQVEFEALKGSPDLLRDLGRILCERSTGMAADLGLAATVDGAPPFVLARLFAAVRRGGDTTSNGEERLRRYLKGGLLSQHPGHILLNPALLEAGALAPASPNALARVAHALLSDVSDISSLSPHAAALVMTAHTLAVAAGDVDLAQRTATTHADGLLEIARRLSEDGDFERAWGLYDGLTSMLGARSSQEVAAHPRSYALNYRAWNGLKAGRIDLARALEDVSEAARLWPENASWHGHRVRLLIRLGRPAEAVAAVEEAEEVVPDHERRALHLRIKPAYTLCRVGLLQAALDVLEPVYRELRPEGDPASAVRDLFRDLARGEFSVAELSSAPHRIVFRTPRSVRLSKVTDRWAADLADPSAHAVGSGPRAALLALAERLVGETERLVRTPTPWLRPDHAARKAVLDAAIDLIRSDIGLPFASERWFVGPVEDGHLQIRDGRVDAAVPVPGREGEEPGLWFGLVDIDRAGFPMGVVKRLEPAGSRLTWEQLRQRLDALSSERPDAP